MDPLQQWSTGHPHSGLSLPSPRAFMKHVSAQHRDEPENWHKPRLPYVVETTWTCKVKLNFHDSHFGEEKGKEVKVPGVATQQVQEEGDVDFTLARPLVPPIGPAHRWTTLTVRQGWVPAHPHQHTGLIKLPRREAVTNTPHGHREWNDPRGSRRKL